MVNKPKQKGTALETYWADRLKTVWPGLRRAEANSKSRDLRGAPFPIELKHRRRWEIPEWSRRLHELNARGWLLICRHGDSRLKSSPPEVMVMPAVMGELLLKVAFEAEPELLADALGEVAA